MTIIQSSGFLKGNTPLNAALFRRRMQQRYRGMAEEEMIRFQTRVAFEIFKRVLEKSPVDTGRSRNAWLMTVNSPATTVPLTSTPIAITQKLTDAQGVLNKYEVLGVIWLTNNVTYIRELEQGKPGPGSRQAPQGMVAISLKEVTNAL